MYAFVFIYEKYNAVNAHTKPNQETLKIKYANQMKREEWEEKKTQTINDVLTHTQCKINYTDTALNEIICRPLHTN